MSDAEATELIRSSMPLCRTLGVTAGRFTTEVGRPGTDHRGTLASAGPPPVRRRPLYHPALLVSLDVATAAIEMAPVWVGRGHCDT